MIDDQKTAVSLLISVVLTAVFAVASFAGFFSVIEARFYQPAVVKGVRERIEKIVTDLDEYIFILSSRLSTVAFSRIMQYSFDTTLSDEDIKRREDFCGIVITETIGLRGMRLVDSNGRRIHYSTFPGDVMRQSPNELAYVNYSALGEIDYGLVRATVSDGYAVYFDKSQNRLIFSFPVLDNWKAYRGTLIFYLDANDFGRYLTARNSIRLTDIPTLAAAFSETQDGESRRQNRFERGFVFGSAAQARDALIGELESLWKKNLSDGQNTPIQDGITRLATVQDAVWVVFSNSRSRFGIIAWLYPEDFFLLPLSARLVLLASIFITVYLIVFLTFSIRRDPMIAVRNRIRRFQISLIQEYFDTKESIEWDRLADEIALRRHEVSAEIKKSLGRRTVTHKDTVDALLEKSWEEILAVIGKKAETRRIDDGQVSVGEIKAMLEQIISSAAFRARTEERDFSVNTGIKKIEDADELEELENIEYAEPIDEIGEALMDFGEELDAPPEKIREIKNEIIDELVKEHAAARSTELFDEEPRIGIPGETADTGKNLDMEFKVFNQDFSFLDAIEESNDDAHDLLYAHGGEMPLYEPFDRSIFSGVPQELRSADADVIIEADGVYTIPEDAAVSGVEQDPEFKTLVDSVLTQADTSSTA